MSGKTGEAWLGSRQKRAMDISMAGMISPLLVPLVALSAGIITASEREAPFIMQQRYGKGGAPITIAKLRTMPHGTEETMSDGHYDARRTKFGRILSLTRLDETPQLWNVLRGEMSMVGLRPLVKVHHDEFTGSLHPKVRAKVDKAYEIAKPGWFDPYGVALYVDGVEDTHEARAESIIKYVFEEASAGHDLKIMFGALGIVKNIVGPTEIDLLPATNPPALDPSIVLARPETEHDTTMPPS